MSLPRLLLYAYLWLFTLFASDRQNARREQELIVGSIEYFYSCNRASGLGVARAAILAAVAHIGELHPLAVFRKVQADDECAGHAAHEPVSSRWIVSALAVALAVLSVLVLSGAVRTALVLLILSAALLLSATGRSWRGSSSRLLLSFVPILMLWPFAAARVSSALGADLLIVAFVTSLLLAVTTLGVRKLGAQNTRRGWSAEALLVSAPVGWAMVYLSVGAAAEVLSPVGLTRDPTGAFAMSHGESIGVLRILTLVGYFSWLGLVLAQTRDRAGGVDGGIPRPGQ